MKNLFPLRIYGFEILPGSKRLKLEKEDQNYTFYHWFKNKR